MSQKNVEIAKRVWEAVERSDTDAIFALFDPDIVWDQSTLPSPTAGIYHGHHGVRQLFQNWLETFETFEMHPETFIDAGQTVVVGIQIGGRGKASGAAVEMRRWNVYRIQNGLVVRIDLFETKAEALEAAGLQE